jgi:hypothetical protein
VGRYPAGIVGKNKNDKELFKGCNALQGEHYIFERPSGIWCMVMCYPITKTPASVF